MNIKILRKVRLVDSFTCDDREEAFYNMNF